MQQARIRAFWKRLQRFRVLCRSHVDTAKLMRTGATAAIAYRGAAHGVPTSTLRAQRRLVAAAAAPSAGTCGQDLDLALMLADGSESGRADPAYDAHEGPIRSWAMAIWEGWIPRESLTRLVEYP